MRIAALQIHEIDLVERVVGFTFALEDERGAVFGEVSFPGALAAVS